VTPLEKAKKIMLANPKDAQSMLTMIATELGSEKLEEIVDIMVMTRIAEDRRAQVKADSNSGIFTEK
jgi:hypothetical protein